MITFYRNWTIWQNPSTGLFVAIPPHDLAFVRSFTCGTFDEAQAGIDAWWLEQEEGTLWARCWSPWPLLVGIVVGLAALAAGIAGWLL